MTEQSNIERIVMQRVYLIRALRFAISSGAFSMLVTVFAIWGIGREVWIAHVLQNAPKDFFDLPRFYFAAFLHTRLIVKGLIVLTVLALFYVIREVNRARAFMRAAGV